MEDSKHSYTAGSRIPVRPLSIDNKNLALPKELIIDYENSKIYICNMDGEIIDITAKILDQTDGMIEQNLKNYDEARSKIYYGKTEPENSLGSDGDIYILYTDEE